ncbi:MAG: hypothetical protein BWY07_00220 [Candidatus Hydrogenedentes bacterium ADurb.Bin170]|jgi:hypothetical protein|nr:MAG: hypothetical protein BWY07_00220 [Candidatus Hydrogenedentes bacterium ADurb.Bin170]
MIPNYRKNESTAVMAAKKKEFSSKALIALAEATGADIAAQAEAPPDRNTLFALLEKAWSKAGVPSKSDVWFPEYLDGMKLNCGFAVDFLLDKRLAVMIASPEKPKSVVEEELGFCTDNHNFEACVMLNFGKKFRCIPFEYNTITGSWLRVPEQSQNILREQGKK